MDDRHSSERDTGTDSDDGDFFDVLDHLDDPADPDGPSHEQQPPDQELVDVTMPDYPDEDGDGAPDQDGVERYVVDGVLVDDRFDDATDADGEGVGPLTEFHLPADDRETDDDQVVEDLTGSADEDEIDHEDEIDQRSVGLYAKFDVTRLDGRDAPGGDREGARYFVLDYRHDEHAAAALAAYAASCQHDYPELAADLRAELSDPTVWGMRRYHDPDESCEQPDCFDCRDRFPD